MARKQRGPSNASGKSRYEHPIPGRDEILAALEDAAQPLVLDALARRFGIRTDPHAKALEQRLKAMVRDGQLIRNRAHEYCLIRHLDLVTGRVQAHRDGFGFLLPDDGGEDVYLSGRQMRTLWDGDRIAVRVTEGKSGRREGHLVEILSRAKQFIVGAFHRERGIDYVLEEGDARTEVLIGRRDRGGAKPGDIVNVEVLEYPTQSSVAIGRVVEIVGRFDQPGVETDVAILAHGIPDAWPDVVLAAAGKLPDHVTPKAVAGREDLRALPLVTIDGADAKDFDDAVFCERRGEGWRLIVAIADVSHYVETDTPLDREARARGTSVYFPDRVVPMLPEALSNGLCSLNPMVDRLCLACEMRVSAQGRVTRSRFFEAVMRSHARLTYGESWQILSVSHPHGEHADLKPRLESLHDVYRAFAKARKRRGAIDFELPELVIHLNEQGKVAELHPSERLTTHKIIEECMIAANVEAAKKLRRARIPALYRVHEGPDEDRIEELTLFLRSFGLKTPPPGKLTPQHFSRSLEHVRGRPEAELIETVLLRSMKQAVYQPKNLGHFGLALDAYAHFTSPIRRYPDLLVHRAIKWLLGHRSTKGFAYSLPEMQRLGEQCSRAERRANEAVWDVEEQLKCIFMRERIGETFEVMVSGVVPFGLFVRVPESHVDGLVHVSSLPRDYYHRDAMGTTLTGERTGRTFKLTDALTVRLASVDLEERKIDFALLDAGHEASGSGGARPAGRRGRTRRRG